MAVFVAKCDCGEMIQVSVGDKIYDDTFVWFQSYECSHCGKAVELDGVDEMPFEIRKIILEQEGLYGVCLCDMKDRTKAEFILRKAQREHGGGRFFFKEETDVILKGTQNEMLMMKRLLEERKIYTYVKKLNEKDDSSSVL